MSNVDRLIDLMVELDAELDGVKVSATAAAIINAIRPLLDDSSSTSAEAQAFAHVIIEAGVIPGISAACRCEECRLTAQKMDEAGYLDFVEDRWWNEPLTQPEES
jgi:hypothetical protein